MTRLPVLRRLLRYLRAQAVLDFRWVTRDLQTVLTYYGSDLVLNAAAVLSVLLLAERFSGIGVWSKTQIIFMLGYALLATALPSMFFSYNVLFISRRIGRGQMDHILIQPRPIWMALATEGFAPFSDSIAILPGLALLIWAASRVPVTVTPLWVALLALNLMASAGIVLGFQFLWGTLAFWAPRAGEEISSSSLELITQLKSFPLTGVGSVLLAGLLTIVPVGFVAWFPCRALLRIDSSRPALFVTPLASLVLVAVAVALFRKGMQQYGRSGSQRYLSLGHRR
jgi:ABC-2 type transport system permease protein